MSVKIKSLELKSFKCFEDFSIDCTRADGSVYQWTVFLGNNNTGKTNLLKAVADLRPVKDSRPTPVSIVSSDDKTVGTVSKDCWVSSFLGNSADREFELLRVSSVLVSGSIEKEWGYASFTMETQGREQTFRSSDVFNLDEFPFFSIYAYGVSRYPAKTSLAESKSEDCATLFSQDQRLLNIEEWLMQLDYAKQKDGDKSERAGKILSKIKEQIFGKVLPEVMDFRAGTSESLSNYIEFETKDGWFRYNQLGYGYQSMLSWVIDLCKRMFDRYENLENPLAGDAIVLVDEIDLHLHPQWQREVIQRLSDVFPNTQFIATTHSPLVLQSMSDVNLYTLTREGQKVSVERHPRSSFVGWTVEEILGEVMHLEEDVYTDAYQKQRRLFEDGLQEGNVAKVHAAYKALKEMMHPANPVRRILELQLPE